MVCSAPHILSSALQLLSESSRKLLVILASTQLAIVSPGKKKGSLSQSYSHNISQYDVHRVAAGNQLQEKYCIPLINTEVQNKTPVTSDIYEL
jgi:hypothetical protein